MVTPSKLGEYIMRIFKKNAISADKLRAELEEARRFQEQCLASGVNPSTWMETAFEEADFAFGYWPDDTGIERAILKGDNLLKEIVEGKEVEQFRVLRVLCREQAEAEAMSQLWGDDRPKAT